MPADIARVGWLGHAGVALEIDGVRAVVDPLLTRRLGHLRRRGALPRDADLGADVVLISHAHADHLHRPSLRRVAALSPGATIVVPVGASTYAAGLGFAGIREVGTGDRLDLAGLDIGVVAADHPRGRSRWSQPDTEAVGYVVERSGKRAYHAGDTGPSDAMTSLGRIDLACLPISGWWKTLGPGHLDPAQAARAVAIVDPARVLAIHWGTYTPEDLRSGLPAWTAEGWRTFGSELARHRLLDRLLPLEPGGSARW